MCFGSVLKAILFCANVLFALAGIALITVGSLSVANYHKLDDAIPEDYKNLSVAPILTITVGSIIFLISFLGCCGACQENVCMLSTYSVILLVLLLIQIGIGIFAFLEIKDKSALETKVDSTFDKIYANQDKNKELIKLIEEELTCCGIDKNGIITPPRCLNTRPGCNKKFYDFVISSAQAIGISALVLGLTEILGTVFSLCLANSIRNGKRRDGYYN